MNKMKKFVVLFLMLAVFVLLCSVSVAEPITGDCGALLSWSLDENGKLTISGEGEMYNYHIDYTPWINNDSITSVEICNGVTSITKGAFRNCGNLTDVSIPDSLTSIGAAAFDACCSLTDVTIPNSVTSIGDQSFRNCSSLTSITISSGLKSIGEQAFQGCINLTGSIAIPESVKSIGEGAFSNCCNLTSITIPDDMIRIKDSMFSGCSNLKSITMSDEVYSIGNFAFCGCISLESISTLKNVTNIGKYAFSSCQSLESISIPRVSTIEEGTFNGCTGLKSVSIGASSIGDSAFSYCVNLKHITLPDGVNYIESGAFRGCSSLTSMVFPDTLEEIKAGTFEDCSNLSDITLRIVSGYGFDYLDGIKIRTGSESIIIHNGIRHVVFADDVKRKRIGLRMFSGCSSLESITIPQGIEYIDSSAFEDCTSLKSITIPDSVVGFGYVPFYNCPSSLTIYCNPGSAAWEYAKDSGRHFACITHVPSYHKKIEPTCTSEGEEAYWECPNCGMKFSDETATSEIKGSVAIAKLGHSWGSPTYTWAKDKSAVTAKRICTRDSTHKETETVKTALKVTTKPTYTATGKGTYTSKAFTNTAFQVQKQEVVLAMLPRTSITKATIKAIDDQLYTGSAIKPALTVKYNGKKLVKGTDYSVTFENNIKPGKATVTIKGKNAYKGKVTVTFKILPKKVKLVSLKAGKKKITVTWNKGKAITGYEIEYSTKKDFSKSKTVDVTGASTVTTKIKNLKPGKTYYVRIRTYKKVGSKKYYSDWSDKMKATVPEE